MDQRKVNMLAREVGPKLGFWKPVVVSHHMLMGLQAPPSGLRTRKELEESRIAEVRQTLKNQSLWKKLDADRAWDQVISELEDSGFPWAAQLLGESSDHVDWLMKLDERLAGAKHANEASAWMKEASQRMQRMLEIEIRIVEAPVIDFYTDPDAPERRPGPSKAEVDALVADTRAFLPYLQWAEDQLRAVGADWEAAQSDRLTAMKMSKSNPDSAIFMTDTPEQVKAKIKKAFCPEKQAQDNPILEYYRYIVFERVREVKIERPAKFGGDLTFTSYAELEQAFAAGQLHPMDAKNACAAAINRLLDPVREHFEKNAEARALKEQVDSFKVTR
jgi:hypothetical protein